MSYLFGNCSSLKKIPDITKWNTSNVIEISGLFYQCSSLESLPDLSKFETNNVIFMNSIFNGCKNLKHLPDISIWNTDNVISISFIFKDCLSLNKLPDISKWKIYKENSLNKLKENYKDEELLKKNISCFIYQYKNLECINANDNITGSNETTNDNITKLLEKIDPNEMTNFPEEKLYFSLIGLYSGCSFLKILPDISNWNTKDVKNFNYMFYNCNSLEQLPDISNWKTDNVIEMKNIFSKCLSLKSLPNLSKWN